MYQQRAWFGPLPLKRMQHLQERYVVQVFRSQQAVIHLAATLVLTIILELSIN
jgi:hypothetical protein